MDKKQNYSASLYKHSELTEQIIGAFYDVYSKLGYGFLEDVYVKALVIELKKRGIIPVTEKPSEVYYEVGLLLNFGPRPETKRRSFDNNRKEWWLAQNKS